MSDRDDLARERDALLIETARAVEALMDLARFSCGFEELSRARVAHQSGALQSARERLEDTVKRARR